MAVHLNIGSNEWTVPGFVNLDIEPLGDVRCDLLEGIPCAAGAVDGVYSEHFIEHIPYDGAVAFLRECRRVTKEGGRIRIATPDLRSLVERYLLEENWRYGDMYSMGHDWVRTRCEMLNVALREWGHTFVYDEEELIRIGRLAGLRSLGRQNWGESDYVPFKDLEHRDGSRLIVEFEVSRPTVRTDDPLVSVLIPAYRPQFLDEALHSARGQTYENIEIVVSDDCPDDAVADVVSRHVVDDNRVRYVRHEGPAGGRHNHRNLMTLARGEYIKFLNDDDLLQPDCVRRMARCLNALPAVTLVTSHRRVVDEEGSPLPDIDATVRVVSDDSVLDGIFVSTDILRRGLNWIGEPSTTMFRAADLDVSEGEILQFGGREVIAIGDTTVWLRLLGRGDLLYLRASLSAFRQHSGQQQRDLGWRERIHVGWAQTVQDGLRMGLARPRHRPLPRLLEDKPWWEGDVRRELEDADEKLASGDGPGGLAALDRALVLSGPDPDLFLTRARLRSALGLDGVEDDLRSAIAAEDSAVTARVELARLLLERGEGDEAMLIADGTRDLVPNDAVVASLVARLRARRSAAGATGSRGPCPQDDVASR